MSSLSDPNWSAGAWEATCQTRLVRQQGATDCGVACVAMAAGIDYDRARATFAELGLARPPRPFASNFTDLVRAFRAVGVEGRMRRWRSWDDFRGVGVLKVRSPGAVGRHWHWVVVESHEQYGHIVRDPGSPLVALRNPPMNVSHQDVSRFVPIGNWVQVATQ